MWRRRAKLQRALSALSLPLLDSSFLCRHYIQTNDFVPEWPTLDDVVRRMAEMHFLHEWTHYHRVLARSERQEPAVWRRAEATVLRDLGGWPSEWPWLRRVRLLRRAVAMLKIRTWLNQRVVVWKERFYDPDRGRFLSIGAHRFALATHRKRPRRA